MYSLFLAQKKSPTRGDWVTKVLEEIDEIELHLDLDEIRNRSKNKFRILVKEKVENKAFIYLLEKKESRNSDHSKGKNLEYNDISMADYLCPSDIDISIEEKKWLFKCRIEDIDINANNRWKKENTMCINCLNIEMDQKHLIECPYLLGKNEMVTYIPNITDIYKKGVEEQLYASRILKNYYCIMKAQEDQVNRLNSLVLL